MNSLSVYDFLHEIRHRDVDAVKKLLRQAKRQHIPLSEHIYPELGLILNALYDPCRDENIPFEQSYWQIIRLRDGRRDLPDRHRQVELRGGEYNAETGSLERIIG